MDYSVIVIVYVLMLILPILASINIRRNYKKYKEELNAKRKSGMEVAREILDSHGLNNVYVIETTGDLTDCYDATRKTVKLSSDIYHGQTIAAMSVAAHECGHALQDRDNYTWLRIRHQMFPIVNIANRVAYITLILGFILNIFRLIYLAIALTLISLIFQLVTLPVEFDASNRAKEILEKQGFVDKKELDGVAKMLKSAALTYVAGVLSTILDIVYLLLQANRRR